jgi:hypothetical protein
MGGRSPQGLQFNEGLLPTGDEDRERICGRCSTRQAHQNMSRLLIKLRHAPEDEIQEIRSLLQEHRIEFYETQAGPWGISAPGIWLNDDQQYDQAKALMDEYQENRFREKRAEYERLRRAGRHRTFLQNLLEKPAQVILYSLIVALILYFSISPFFPDG